MNAGDLLLPELIRQLSSQYYIEGRCYLVHIHNNNYYAYRVSQK